MVRAQLTQLLATSALLLAALPVNAQTAATTKVISDQILPRETFVYVSFPNVAALKEYVSTSSMGQLCSDPAFDAFKGELTNAFGSELDDGLAKVQEALGISLEEFLAIPEGEVSLAFSAVPGNLMGASIFVDFGDKESQVRDLLDKAAGVLSQLPKLNQEDSSFDGTELTIFKIQHTGQSPTPLAEEFGWFIKDQRLVIANRTELLEAALTNWSGDNSSSFRSNEAYAYIMETCQSGERTSLSTLYFDPIGLLTKLIQSGSLGPELSMGASMAMGVLPSIGLTQMKALGTVSEPGTGAFEAVSSSVFYAEQPPAGLMKMMKLDAIETAPPSWVKDDATVYAAAKWSIADAYNAVESVADMFAGPGFLASKIDELADQGPGIHIKQDIIDQLTGELRFITVPGESGSVGSDQVLVALGVTDEASASEVVARLAEIAGLEAREFRSTTIYEMSIPGDDEHSLGLAVVDGKLILAMGSDALEQTVRNDNDRRPLAESEDYLRVAEHFPKDALAVQFSRPAEQYRGLYENLRSGTAAEQFPGIQDVFEKIDFTTLPEFDVIAGYIHPAGSFTVKDDNGFFMKAFQLKK